MECIVILLGAPLHCTRLEGRVLLLYDWWSHGLALAVHWSTAELVLAVHWLRLAALLDADWLRYTHSPANYLLRKFRLEPFSHLKRNIYRKIPNKRPLGGNIQYGVVEGISTFQVLFTE